MNVEIEGLHPELLHLQISGSLGSIYFRAGDLCLVAVVTGDNSTKMKIEENRIIYINEEKITTIILIISEFQI